MKTVRLSHWLPSKLHCQGPEKYEKHRQDTPSTSGSIGLLWSDDNTFCMEIKNNDFIQHLGTVTSPLGSAILEIIPWTTKYFYYSLIIG